MAALCLCGCAEQEIFSSDEVEAFCERHKRVRISREVLFERLANTRFREHTSDGMVRISVIGDDDIHGLDTCWHSVEYNPEKQLITDCGFVCQ